jgi:TRAP-type C4-dicarboxylate transport system permease small subunit
LRAHITVDLLVRRLPAAGRQSAVLLTLLAGIVFFGALVWGAVPLAWDSWKLNEIAVAAFQFPVWPGKIAFALGAVLGLVEIMRQLVWWCAGDREGAGGEAPAATAVEAI